MSALTSSEDEQMLIRDRFESDSDSADDATTPILNTTLAGRARDKASNTPFSQVADLAAEIKKVREAKAAKKKPRPSYRRSTIHTRPIPKSFKDCDEADTMLVECKDAGMAWAEIKEKYEQIRGERVAASSLPNRYERLKRNFCVLTYDDQRRLLIVKQKVEKEFEAEKWIRISGGIVDEGGEAHDPKALQRMYRRMMTTEGAVLPQGVKDADLEVEDE